jgi:hypothetical protein
MKSIYYGPNGCSRSPAMDKILLLKKINKGELQSSRGDRALFGSSKIRNKEKER